MPQDRRTAAVIEHAAAKLGRVGGRFEGVSGALLWALLQMAGLALESSTLIDDADDSSLLVTQQYMRQAAILLEASDSESDAWNGWLANHLGPPLALVILALVRSGQTEILELLAEETERLGRQSLPSRPSRHRVKT